VVVQEVRGEVAALLSHAGLACGGAGDPGVMPVLTSLSGSEGKEAEAVAGEVRPLE